MIKNILYIKKNKGLINLINTMNGLRKFLDEQDHYKIDGDTKKNMNHVIEDSICSDIIYCKESHCAILYNIGTSAFAITDLDNHWTNFDGNTIFAQYTLNDKNGIFGLELNSNFTYILTDIPDDILKRIAITLDYLIKNSKRFSKIIDNYISKETLYYNCKQFNCLKVYTFDMYNENNKLISPNVQVELTRSDDSVINELEQYLLRNDFVNDNEDYGLTNYGHTCKDTIFTFEVTDGKTYIFKRH